MKETAVGNIIKADKRARPGVLKHRTLEAKAEAEAIVAAANEYAEKTAEKAQDASKRAYQKAKKKGEEDALREYQEQVLAAIELRDRALAVAEQDLVRLSVKLAEKIVGRELRTDRETVVDIISTALQHARQKENLLIRVNPADLSTAQKELERFKSYSRSKFIDISADPRVGKGGCLIESEVGTVDARLETQFRVLSNALLSRAEGEAAAEEE